MKKTFEKEMSSKEKTFEKKESPGKKPSTNSSRPVVIVVIVVIDEARSLLAKGHNNSSHFRMLRQALLKIAKDEGVFGVLVDTNPKISDLTLPVSLERQRISSEEEYMACMLGTTCRRNKLTSFLIG